MAQKLWPGEHVSGCSEQPQYTWEDEADEITQHPAELTGGRDKDMCFCVHPHGVPIFTSNVKIVLMNMGGMSTVHSLRQQPCRDSTGRQRGPATHYWLSQLGRVASPAKLWFPQFTNRDSYRAYLPGRLRGLLWK